MKAAANQDGVHRKIVHETIRHSADRQTGLESRKGDLDGEGAGQAEARRAAEPMMRACRRFAVLAHRCPKSIIEASHASVGFI
ncbi:MAG: hypothetical protein ACREFM_16710, partial [Hypericibacter sp.]